MTEYYDVTKEMLLINDYCVSGYAGHNGQCCIDVNECDEGLDNCHSEATCDNTVPGFSSTCKTGFTGDGRKCAGHLLILVQFPVHRQQVLL